MAQITEKTKKVTTSVKKAAVQKETVSAADLSDLYIVTNGKLLATRQFKKHISPVYGCEELYWKGKLTPDTVLSFMTSAKQNLPAVDCYTAKGGPGLTLDGSAAIAAFRIDNALTITSANGEQIYNYCNPESKIVYIGDNKIHTVYVRIYDDAEGTVNGRWLVLSLD